MSETVTSEFRVLDTTRSDVWVKDQRTGLVAAIERRPGLYDPPLRDAVLSLEKYDFVTATVESLNEGNTRWRFTSIEVESE